MTPGAGIPPDKQPLVHKSFADWVREQKLGNKVEEWIRITLECEIGTGWDRISALDGISEFHIFLGEGETSYRVAGGNVKFINALANDVGRNNISVNKRVIRIAHKDGRSRVTFLASDTNRNEEIEARHVILTVPLYRLMEIQFEPELSRAKREAIVSMTWGSYFKVHVLVPKTSEQFWTASLPLLSDSDLGVIYDGNPDQPAGKDSLRVLSLLIGGDRAERLNFTPLDQARAEMKAAFDKLWPGFSKTIVDMEFYRYHPRAIASWPVGRSRFDLQSDEIRKPENRVYLAGDHTESSHSDGAVNSAARAVAQILQAEGMKPGESLGAKHKKSRKNLSKLINGKKQEGRKHEPVTKKL